MKSKIIIQMLAASLTVSIIFAGCANSGTAATEKPADESIVTSSQNIESENLKSILEANGELDSIESDDGAQDKGKLNKENSSDSYEALWETIVTTSTRANTGVDTPRWTQTTRWSLPTPGT